MTDHAVIDEETVRSVGAKLTEMATPEALRGLGTELITDPFCVRFIQKELATLDNRIYTPEDVIGERLQRLGILLIAEAGRPNEIQMNVKPEHRTSSLLAIAIAAVKAPPYLLAEDIRSQIQSLKMPRHVISPTLLPQNIWLTFETGIGIADETTADWLFLADTGDGFTATIGGELGPDRLVLHPSATQDELDQRISRQFIQGHRYRYGSTYPDDYPDDPQIEGLLQLIAFINSPFIPVERRRPQRQARRDASREGSPFANEEVGFIILRRPANTRNGSSEEGEPVAWKHRWLVSGHYRAQWYPSEQAHHVIWIAPHMKGPAEAPLLEHVFKVAR